MTARKIFTQKIVVVASPDFCRKFGTPESLEDLERLPSITQINGEWGRVHYFTYRGEILPFDTPQHCTMNSARGVRNACLTGYGFSLLPDFMVASDLAAERLVRLVPEYESVEQDIYALYAERRYMPQKIRVFLDYLMEAFGAGA